jgi:hypothetical protein
MCEVKKRAQLFKEKMKNICLFGIAGLSLAGVVLCSSVALAEETICDGDLGAVTLDNVKIPSDKSCNMNGTTVKGTIKVEPNAQLTASDIKVNGNIQAENAENVTVNNNSTVDGSIQIKQSKAANITRTRIKQDLQFEKNTNQLVANDNTITGNLQVFQNTGGVEIRRNSINGNLQCRENAPSPSGEENRVRGNKEDQCASL